MAYQPIARKYRPVRFSELVGQEAISVALSNAIRLGREPHAVIFSGVRGVGKTTTARLYAKALNCEKGPTPEPCGSCASCLAIALGKHEDVLEIDGASHTGVDNVRELQENLGYVPQRSKFKIYIIDEVHMLSTSAFNALLKTLEEPPAHVAFLFATTELNKIPKTIISRCQTFHMQKLRLHAIAERIRTILAAENISCEEKALMIMAREGRGSMRDALTLLDQVIAIGDGKVTVAGLAHLTPNLSSLPYLELLEALVVRDANAAMASVSHMDEAGIDFASAVEDVARLTRHAFVVKALGGEALSTALLGLDEGELARLHEITNKAAPFDLNRIFRTLVHCRGELDGSGLDRFIVENYCFEWCLDPGLPSVDELQDLLKGRPAAPAAHSGARHAMAPASMPVPDHGPRAQSPASPQAQTAPERPRISLGQAFAQATANPAPATAPTAQTAPTAAQPARSLPADWAALVDVWKREKPLQGRHLEETYLVEYGPTRIVVSVSEETVTGRSLLQKASQEKIQSQFGELFDFKGHFSVIPRPRPVATPPAPPDLPTYISLPAPTMAPPVTSPAPVAPTMMPPPPPPPAEESLFEKRQRETEVKKASLIERVTNDPFTRDVVETFNGRIENVVLKEDKNDP